jgi:hypothetical protein
MRFPCHSNLLWTLLFPVFSGLIAFCAPAEAAPDRPSPAVLVEEVPLPDALSLCGEPMPLEKESVREMLDRELTISAWDRAQVFMWLKRAGRYFPYIEEQLAKEGLPDDLKYLAVAESALIPHIRSPVGAMGHWQFMPQTARSKGLRKDRQIDERRDFEKSTKAAISYLKFLREKFGNWTLAMAAYNCGDSRLSQQMKDQRADSYYRLNLPNETERYIFRIAAVKLILEDPGRYGYRIPETRVYRPVPCDKVQVNMSTSVPIVEVAEALGTDFKTIKDLNPHILGDHMPQGHYTVRVPPGNGPRLARALKDLAGAFATRKGRIHQGDVYVVKPGDTLSAISRRSGVPVDTIRRLNNIDGSVIRVGQRLKLDS